MKHFRYCGWVIASEWKLSPFAPLIGDASGHADIMVRRAPVPTALPNAVRSTAVWAINRREGLWGLDGVARYRVCQEGRLIEVEPAVGADAETVALFLLRAVLPLAALYRGEFLLSGSAVAWEGKACAFVGPSGVGKSTVAAVLVQNGWDLVGDSLLRVTRDTRGKFHVHPQCPELWLWDDMREQFGFQAEFCQVQKTIQLRRQYFPTVADAASLRRIIVLSVHRGDNDSLQTEQSHGGHAFETLIHYLAGAGWQHTIADRARLFQWATDLAKQIEIQKLELPRFENMPTEYFKLAIDKFCSYDPV